MLYIDWWKGYCVHIAACWAPRIKKKKLLFLKKALGHSSIYQHSFVISSGLDGEACMQKEYNILFVLV